MFNLISKKKIKKQQLLAFFLQILRISIINTVLTLSVQYKYFNYLMARLSKFGALRISSNAFDIT